MVTAAEILQIAQSLARQQPPPGPAQLQSQPARDGGEEGSSDDDAEAGRIAGAGGMQQATGKRKRRHGGVQSRKASRERWKERQAQRNRDGEDRQQEMG
jgi:hypothetical protein